MGFPHRRLLRGFRCHGACAPKTIPCSVAYARYQADLGSPFVPLPLHIVTGSKAVNYRQANVNLGGQPRTQAVGSVLARVTLLHWGLEFRRQSFNHISRVLRYPLGSIYPAATRVSLRLCSPRPFRGAFRAMAVVTRMTLLLLLTYKNLLWR